jgi:hypothetical protein
VSKRRWRHLGLARNRANRRAVTSSGKDHLRRILIALAIPRRFRRSGSCTRGLAEPDARTRARRVPQRVTRHVDSRDVQTARVSVVVGQRTTTAITTTTITTTTSTVLGYSRLMLRYARLTETLGRIAHRCKFHLTSPGSSSRVDHGALQATVSAKKRRRAHGPVASYEMMFAQSMKRRADARFDQRVIFPLRAYAIARLRVARIHHNTYHHSRSLPSAD